MVSFYNEEELKELGFNSFGNNVQISRKASFYNTGFISLGNNVRIDDFCVLSAGDGGIEISDYVHIAVFSSLIGRALISMGEYSGLSSHVHIYSSNEDYSGEYMTNPTVESEYRNVTNSPVMLKRHVIIGTSSVILPGVTIEEGACVGAMSLVNKNCDAFKIYAGIPVKYIKERSRGLLKIERKMKVEKGLI